MKAYLTVRGETVPVTLQVKKYYDGGLCINLIDQTEGYHPVFCRLTVSLGQVPDVDMSDSAFLDTNDCPWAEEFVTKLGIAVPSGITQQSGHWIYPLYYFNLEEINKYVEV